ncbi:MAG: IPT/TIG domain-containing protein [Nitrososphaerales archaeon]
MASAASRARRAENEVLRDEGDEETGSRRLVARSTTSGRAAASARFVSPRQPHTPARGTEVRPPPPGAGGRWRNRSGVGALSTRTLLITALVVAVVVAAGIALALSLRSPAKPATTHVRIAAPSPHTPHGGTSPNAAKTPGTKPRSAGSPTTGHTKGTAPPVKPATRATAAPGVAPRLASISPATGSDGQSVVIDGSGLFSTDGEVVAYFGGSAAPTRCSSQTSCTVTVPDLGALPSTVHLTVITANGRSNALTFSYL